MNQFIELHQVYFNCASVPVFINVKYILKVYDVLVAGDKECAKIEFCVFDSTNAGLVSVTVEESYFEVCEKIRCALRNL